MPQITHFKAKSALKGVEGAENLIYALNRPK